LNAAGKYIIMFLNKEGKLSRRFHVVFYGLWASFGTIFLENFYGIFWVLIRTHMHVQHFHYVTVGIL